MHFPIGENVKELTYVTEPSGSDTIGARDAGGTGDNGEPGSVRYGESELGGRQDDSADRGGG